MHDSGRNCAVNWSMSRDGGFRYVATETKGSAGQSIIDYWFAGSKDLETGYDMVHRQSNLVFTCATSIFTPHSIRPGLTCCTEIMFPVRGRHHVIRSLNCRTAIRM